MKKTIRSQIMFGYSFIITVPVIITIVTVLSLYFINSDVQALNRNRENQNATKDAIVGHYSWIIGLGETIQDGKEFTGSLDPETCSLGKWMNTVSPEDLKDPVILEAIDTLKAPHNAIHNEAQKLIDLSRTDPAAAYKEYTEQVKPQVAGIISHITVITNKYAEFSVAATSKLGSRIVTLMIFCIGLLILGSIAALILGKRTAERISKPIEIVADYSKKLALGADDISFEEIDALGLDDASEASVMIKAFEVMVKSIQNNVSVVKRVAEGDLTAFVDIRSSGDSLGQNLYHMVQSNDLMFSDILRVASEVASSANQISQASHSLADSATQQAGSTEKLSSTMQEVNELTLQNKEKVAEVIETFDSIQSDVNKSGVKMNELVDAVDDIRAASDKISAVIKTIDDLAFQTNILALNAAVEAARAGAAGKGFAVVADEVRNLASKSANAADETKELIENTIGKAHSGTKMAKDTYETFAKINESLTVTAGIVGSISDASEKQVEKIQAVYEDIDVLLRLSTTNAASCEESSAASHEMHRNAGHLRNSMKKFNLRQRQYGTAYIPPEKKGDVEFIRQANENYKKALEEGTIREEQLSFAK